MITQDTVKDFVQTRSFLTQEMFDQLITPNEEYPRKPKFLMNIFEIKILEYVRASGVPVHSAKSLSEAMDISDLFILIEAENRKETNSLYGFVVGLLSWFVDGTTKKLTGLNLSELSHEERQETGDALALAAVYTAYGSLV